MQISHTPNYATQYIPPHIVQLSLRTGNAQGNLV